MVSRKNRRAAAKDPQWEHKTDSKSDKLGYFYSEPMKTKFRVFFASPEWCSDVLKLTYGTDVNPREIIGPHVNKIMQSIQVCGWTNTGDTILLDSRGRVVNGQHRLAAIMESGEGQWLFVFEGSYFDDDEVKAVIDTCSKPRNLGQLLRKTYGSLAVPVATGVRWCNTVLSGNPFYWAANGPAFARGIARASDAELRLYAIKHIDVFKPAAETVMPAKKATGVSFAPLFTAYVSLVDVGLGDEAETFFTALGDPNTDIAAARQLREQLLTWQITQKSTARTLKSVEVYSATLDYFRAWLDGETPTRINRTKRLFSPQPVDEMFADIVCGSVEG